MKLIKFFILLVLAAICVSGCEKESYSPIDHHQSFIASVNILEPSVVFYDPKGEQIAEWKFEKGYTGAELIEHDRILLYGNQLDEAAIYELSSGKKIRTIKTGIGTTNAYYDEEEKQFFITNSEMNTVTSFDRQGKQLKELRLGNYPMAMTSYDGLLFVVNYKDTRLSVIDIDDFKIKKEWEIDKSSNGLMVVPEKNQLWVGGHGEGSKPNQTIDVYDLSSGKAQDEIHVSLMPVGFARDDAEIYVTNHGANELFAVDLAGEILWKKEVAANPFAVATIDDQIVIAGYDDDKIYFLKDQKVERTIETNEGPFQLLVREVQ